LEYLDDQERKRKRNVEQKGQLKKIGKRKESLDTKEEERTIQTKGKYNYK